MIIFLFKDSQVLIFHFYFSQPSMSHQFFHTNPKRDFAAQNILVASSPAYRVAQSCWMHVGR